MGGVFNLIPCLQFVCTSEFLRNADCIIPDDDDDDDDECSGTLGCSFALVAFGQCSSPWNKGIRGNEWPDSPRTLGSPCGHLTSHPQGRKSSWPGWGAAQVLVGRQRRREKLHRSLQAKVGDGSDRAELTSGVRQQC